MERQLGFEFRVRGGRRRGAGRKPKGKRAGVSHRPRPRITRHVPAHVTMRVRKDVWNLRTRRVFFRLWAAFQAASERLGARLIQFSVQGNHIHLIVEAESERALGRAMKGLAVRIARSLNRAMDRRGPVFEDRFHMRPLKTPREVRRAYVYVLNNDLHHEVTRRGREFDWFSSAPLFDGWARARAAMAEPLHRPTSRCPSPKLAPDHRLARQPWIPRIGTKTGTYPRS